MSAGLVGDWKLMMLETRQVGYWLGERHWLPEVKKGREESYINSPESFVRKNRLWSHNTHSSFQVSNFPTHVNSIIRGIRFRLRKKFKKRKTNACCLEGALIFKLKSKIYFLIVIAEKKKMNFCIGSYCRTNNHGRGPKHTEINGDGEQHDVGNDHQHLDRFIQHGLHDGDRDGCRARNPRSWHGK